MGGDFGQTKEFFHVTLKIPYLCPENERVSEPRKMHVGFEQSEKFLTGNRTYLVYALKMTKLVNPGKNGRRFWAD